MTVNREGETQGHARAGGKITADGSGRRSRRRRLCAGAAVMAVFCGIGAVAAAPARAGTGIQFSDGSFEAPVVTPGTYQDLSQGQSIGPWTVTTGLVDLIGAGYWQAADGVQSVDLNGQTAAIPDGESGAVSQTFTTTPLVAYEVSYALAGNPLSQGSPLAGPLTKTGEVLVNGHVVEGFSFNVTGKSPTNMGYVTKEFAFLATGTSTTLEFASTNPGEGGPVIDNVRVERCLLVVCLN
jgi:choice-of-anchor C domain-containing protein